MYRFGAGFIPAPYFALYSSTKHAVEDYSESLDHELRPSGIRPYWSSPLTLIRNVWCSDNNQAIQQFEGRALGALDAEAKFLPRLPGRPTKLNPEVAEAICAAVASGSSVTLELRQLKIDAWSHNRWLRDNPEFRGKVDEAKAIRNEMASERIWGMSVDQTDHHVRGRLAACHMIQQSLAMQQGGTGHAMSSSMRNRRSN